MGQGGILFHQTRGVGNTLFHPIVGVGVTPFHQLGVRIFYTATPNSEKYKTPFGSYLSLQNGRACVKKVSESPQN